MRTLTAWSEVVLGKGLTFDFFSDTLVRNLQQETIRVLTPLYNEIGACFVGDGWQSTRNRPILNIPSAQVQLCEAFVCRLLVNPYYASFPLDLVRFFVRKLDA
jgi:hypothetical protein